MPAEIATTTRSAVVFDMRAVFAHQRLDSTSFERPRASTIPDPGGFVLLASVLTHATTRSISVSILMPVRP